MVDTSISVPHQGRHTWARVSVVSWVGGMGALGFMLCTAAVVGCTICMVPVGVARPKRCGNIMHSVQ